MIVTGSLAQYERASLDHRKVYRVAGVATPREFESLAALVTAGSYKEAAAALGVHPSTVKNHLMSLHQKTDQTTFQLVHRFRNELALFIATGLQT